MLEIIVFQESSVLRSILEIMFKILLQGKLDVSNCSMRDQWKILQSQLIYDVLYAYIHSCFW